MTRPVQPYGPPLQDRQHLVLLGSAEGEGTVLLSDGSVALPGEVVYIDGEPVAHFDAVVEGLVVPAVGRYVQTPRNGLPGYLIDPDGNEVTLLMRGMRLLGKNGRTADSYLWGLLTFCRFCWAVGIDVETITTPQYLVFRRWLMYCIRQPKEPKAKPPVRKSKGPKRRNLKPGQTPAPRGYRQPGANITAHMATRSARVVEAAVRGAYGALAVARLLPADPIPSAARAVYLSERSPLEAVPAVRISRATPLSVPPLPDNASKEIDVLPSLAQARLLDATYLRDAVIFMLALQSGPRAREVLSIRPEDIAWDARTVSVLAKGRNGARRDVPVTDEWLDLYKRYLDDLYAKGIRLERGISVWRTLRRPYGPLTYKALSDRFTVTLGSLHAAHGLHSLRHTAATFMVQVLCLPVHEAQHILGHASPGTTGKYLHTTSAEAGAAFRRAWATPRQAPAPDTFEYIPADLLKDLHEILGDD